jgi:hypothetical protein
MEGSLTLSGLIIEKNVDPQIITKLLVPIARAKGIPIVSLTGLKASFKKACDINCIALGFKVKIIKSFVLFICLIFLLTNLLVNIL